MLRLTRLRSIALVLLSSGCVGTPDDDVSRQQAAIEIVDGVDHLAEGPEWDAVFCIPQYKNVSSGEACVPSPHWQYPSSRDCVRRCASAATLITPTLLLVNGVGRLTSQGWIFDVGKRTRFDGRPPLQLDRTAYQVGSAANAMDDPLVARGNIVGCLEPRASGIRSCCDHIYIDRDLDGVRDEAYVPDEALWDTPLTDSTAHGGAVTHDALIRSSRSYGTYREYLGVCLDPLEVGDSVVSPYRILALDRAFDEAVVQPIPAALSFPDGTSLTFPVDTDGDGDLGDESFTSWFETDGGSGVPLGTIAGFGDSSGSEHLTSVGSQQGIRRYVRAATDLSFVTDPDDWFYNNSGGHAVQWANREWTLEGDGEHDNGAAGHVDFAAPWLFGSGTERRVYAMYARGVGTSTDYLDNVYTTHMSPPVLAVLRDFLDPDGDGIHRGTADAPAAGYLDRDEDGLSEYRRVPTAEGGSRCLPATGAPGPGAGNCWVATNNDNCAPPLDQDAPDPIDRLGYANSDQSDVDGDGIGDVCDVCPNVWDADTQDLFCDANQSHEASTSPTGRSLRRGDPVGIACLTAGQLADGDGDDVPSLCDNCDGTANPYDIDFDGDGVADRQRDTDNDGIGDACEVPGCEDDWDPTLDEGSAGPDLDEDGVADRCDNCPPSRCTALGLNAAVCANEDQDDSDGDRVGDACDNCGVSNPGQENCNIDSERALLEELLGGEEDPENIAAAAATTLLGDACDESWCPRYEMARQSTGSAFGAIGHATTVGFDGEPYTTPSASHSPVRTGFRFCACDVADDSVAARRTMDCLASCPPNDIDSFDDEFSDVWRLPEDLQFHSHAGSNQLGDEPLITYGPDGPGRPRYWASWDFVSDMVSWSVPMESLGGGLIHRTRGVVWAHAVANEAGENPARALSSFYTSSELERLDGIREPEVEIEHLVDLHLPPEICPACQAFPLPRLVRCIEGICLRYGVPYLDEPNEQGLVWSGERPLREDVYLDGRIDPALYAAVASTGTDWVRAVEPMEWLDGSPTYFVGLSGGAEVVSAGQIDAGVLVNGLPWSFALEHAVTEESRLVVSGRESRLFHVRPGRSLDWASLDDAAQGAIGLTEGLDRVIAVAWIGRTDRALLVVDGSAARTRFLRVDLGSGDVTTLAELGARSRDIALSTMVDGRVVVATCEEGGERLAIMVLDWDANGLRVEGFQELGISGGLRPGSLHATRQGVSYSEGSWSWGYSLSGLRWDWIVDGTSLTGEPAIDLLGTMVQ